MTDKILWRRGPWEIRKTESGRIRVDHGMHSQYPVLYTNKSRPWSVGWDRPEGVPKDVQRKVKSILVKRELGKK